MQNKESGVEIKKLTFAYFKKLVHWYFFYNLIMVQQ